MGYELLDAVSWQSPLQEDVSESEQGGALGSIP